MQKIGDSNTKTIVVGDQSEFSTLVNRVESGYASVPQILYMIVVLLVLTNIFTAIVVGSVVYTGLSTWTELEVLRAALETPP
jgi:hypothetical protein